jgi:hypothetical protein
MAAAGGALTIHAKAGKRRVTNAAGVDVTRALVRSGQVVRSAPPAALPPCAWFGVFTGRELKARCGSGGGLLPVHECLHHARPPRTSRQGNLVAAKCTPRGTCKDFPQLVSCANCKLNISQRLLAGPDRCVAAPAEPTLE